MGPDTITNLIGHVVQRLGQLQASHVVQDALRNKTRKDGKGIQFTLIPQFATTKQRLAKEQICHFVLKSWAERFFARGDLTSMGADDMTQTTW